MPDAPLPDDHDIVLSFTTIIFGFYKPKVQMGSPGRVAQKSREDCSLVVVLLSQANRRACRDQGCLSEREIDNIFSWWILAKV